MDEIKSGLVPFPDPAGNQKPVPVIFVPSKQSPYLFFPKLLLNRALPVHTNNMKNIRIYSAYQCLI